MAPQQEAYVVEGPLPSESLHFLKDLAFSDLWPHEFRLARIITYAVYMCWMQPVSNPSFRPSSVVIERAAGEISKTE